MSRLLLIVPDLAYRSYARQVSLLAPALVQGGDSLAVVSLNGDGPMSQPLRKADIPIYGQQGTHLFDLNDWLTIRHLIRDLQPEILHVWGTQTLQKIRLALLGRWHKVPPIVLHPLMQTKQGPITSWLERRSWKSVRHFLIPSHSERDHLLQAGISSEQVHLFGPVVSSISSLADGQQFRQELGLPADSKMIFCAGSLSAMMPFRDAVWTFDVLKYVFPNLYLIIFGDGPARETLDQFGRSIGREDYRVLFPGARKDVDRILGLADVVWVPHRKNGGIQVAVEAMLAQRVVIAANNSQMQQIIDPEQTGILVPAGDYPAFARQTLRLLEDAALRQRLGQAAQQHVLQKFHLDTQIKTLRDVYNQTRLNRN